MKSSYGPVSPFWGYKEEGKAKMIGRRRKQIFIIFEANSLVIQAKIIIIIIMDLREVKPQRYRYINLVLFVLAGLCNSVSTQAFSAIAPITHNLYKVSELQVNLVTMTNSIMYPFVLFPTNYIIQTYGLKVGTLTGELFLSLGLIIRLLINYHFYFFIIGTFICGLGFCFMLNSPNKFVVNWFPVNQIPLMNAICIFFIFMSDSLGTFASAAFIDKNSTKNDFFNFFATESAIIVTIQILMGIFFRGQPKNPPNFASQIQRQSYKRSLKSLIRNQNYRILFCSMAFIFGALNIFFVCLSWILDIFNFDSFQTGIIFVVAVLSGLTGCFVTGLLFSNTNYKRNCIFYVYACIASLLIIGVGLQTHQAWLLYIGAACFGFNIFPYLTTMTDFASQTAFPVGQSTSGGSLLFGGQILGVTMSLLMTIYVFDGSSVVKTRIGEGIILILMLLGGITLHFSKLTLRRTQYQRQKQNNIVHLLTQSQTSD